MNFLVAESQVADALNVSPRAVRIRAVDDKWLMDRKPKQGGGEVSYIRNCLPVEVKESLVVRESITGAGVPSAATDTLIPKKSREIGLAKYSLVHAYRVVKEKAGWGQMSEAVKGFLLAYNAGLLMPNVFNIVGKIEKRTLENDDKKLAENDDNYLVLCDGRGGWRKHGTNEYKGHHLSEIEQLTLLKCFLHGSRPSVKMVIYATRMTLKKMGITKTASDSTYRRWLDDYIKKNAGVVCMARYGMKAYIDQYGPYISRDANLLEVGQCLVADGKTLNFFILHPDTGRPCRMKLIVFFDWKSRYPVGWQIMPTENQWGILAAFRNAVITLGRYPDSVYLDNGKAFKSKLFSEEFDLEACAGLYARVGTAVMYAKPYNGRSKVVERFFRTIQDQLEFMMPSFCGDSIQTKPPWMHRNEKFQRAWHEARTQKWIPTIREAALIIEAYFNWYAQQPHSDLNSTPEEMFLPHRGQGVDPLQLNHDFLWRKTVQPRNCRVTLWGIDYESDCLLNLSRTEPIQAMVDTADLNKIWCYTKDGVFLGEALPVQACHPLARLFGDQVAVDQVTHENKRQARLIKSTKKQLEDLGITKDAQDSLGILPFAGKKSKVAILPGSGKAKNQAEQPINKLPEKEIQRLEQVIEMAEQEIEIVPEIQRPKFWKSDLDRYEWCFRLMHKHEQEPSPEEKAFMNEFESQPNFKNYRQHFEDLRLLFTL
jgi:putative transposase